jgi:hypothetical protein
VVSDPGSTNPADSIASVHQAPNLGAPEAGQLAPGTPVTIQACEIYSNTGRQGGAIFNRQAPALTLLRLRLHRAAAFRNIPSIKAQ